MFEVSRDYGSAQFPEEGNKPRVVVINPNDTDGENALRALVLHEIGHAVLRHDARDAMDMVRREAAAWRWATAHIRRQGRPWTKIEKRKICEWFGTYVLAKRRIRTRTTTWGILVYGPRGRAFKQQ